MCEKNHKLSNVGSISNYYLMAAKCWDNSYLIRNFSNLLKINEVETAEGFH